LSEEPLYPGSASFRELEPQEREEFLVGFGAVGLYAVLETLFVAKKTLRFDYQYFASLYNERIRKTSVLPIKEVQVPPQKISPIKLASFFGRNPSGEFIFSREGILIVPMLEPFLNELRMLEVIRSRTLQPWESFANALEIELQAEKSLSVPQVAEIAGNMPVPGISGNDRNLPPDKEKEYLKRLKTLLADL